MTGYSVDYLGVPESVHSGLQVRMIEPQKSSIHYPRYLPSGCVSRQACSDQDDFCCRAHRRLHAQDWNSSAFSAYSRREYYRERLGQEAGIKRHLQASVIVRNPPCKEVFEEEEPKEHETLQGEGKAKKNPWGNESYSDLIATAIKNSTMQRLTLPQIYDWFVLNVPYFKDKEHLPSTKGWKNAIRHTLSLRQRFVRLPDPSNPYRSWWMVATDDMRKQRRKKPRWKSRGTQTTFN